MKCEKCGLNLNPGDHFCGNCGTPVRVQYNNNNIETLNLNQNNGYTFNQNVNNNYNQNPNLNEFSYSNSSQNNDNSKKSSKALLIILSIIMFGGAFVYNFIQNYEEYFGKDRVPITISGSEVRLDDVIFTIPYSLKYQISNGALYISNNSETWLAQVQIINKRYETIKKNKKQLIKKDEINGIEGKNANVKKYSDTEFVTFELDYSTHVTIGAYAKLDANRSLGFEIIDDSGNANYSILDELAPVAAAARVEG